MFIYDLYMIPSNALNDVILLSHGDRDHIPVNAGAAVLAVPDIDYPKLSMYIDKYRSLLPYTLAPVSTLQGIETVELYHDRVLIGRNGVITKQGRVITHGYYIKSDRLLVIPETNKFIDDVISSYDTRKLYIQNNPYIHFKYDMQRPLVIRYGGLKIVVPIKPSTFSEFISKASLVVLDPKTLREASVMIRGRMVRIEPKRYYSLAEYRGC